MTRTPDSQVRDTNVRALRLCGVAAGGSGGGMGFLLGPPPLVLFVVRREASLAEQVSIVPVCHLNGFSQLLQVAIADLQRREANSFGFGRFVAQPLVEPSQQKFLRLTAVGPFEQLLDAGKRVPI